MRSILLTVVAGFGVALGGCSSTQSIRIANSTSDDIVVRVAADTWLEAFDCRSGAQIGGFNTEGTYPIQQGNGVCLVGEEPGDDEEWDIRAHVRNVTAIRDGERCMYSTTGVLVEDYVLNGGRYNLDIDNSMCLSAAARQAMQDANQPTEDDLDELFREAASEEELPEVTEDDAPAGAAEEAPAAE